jgi:beta-glucanase (GH16 family)
MRNALSIVLLILSVGVALSWGNQVRDRGGGEKVRGGLAPAPGSRVVMRDDFNGSKLNSNLWNTCHWWERVGCTIATNHELERYWPGQVQLGGGVARLVAQRNSDDPAHPFASGMIASGPPFGSERPRFSFRYGTVTIRARIPTGPGLWPGLWLLPVNRHSEPEIDVMEILGREPDVVRMHLHYRDRAGREQAPGATFTDAAIPSGWHTFSIRWRPRSLTWLVDGVQPFRLTGDRVPRKRMYLIANLAVGGGNAGPPTAETPFPSAFELDYIEVRK